MTRKLRRVAVYCGSSNDVRDEYFDAAREMGRLLAQRGLGMVYGAGNVGLMGVCADAALEGGAEVVGVIPNRLMELEVGHKGLTELIVVDSMHARKMVMASLSDAFVALPGGIGTLDELFEVTTWNQLGYHAKPAAMLNVSGYFDSLLTFLEHAKSEGFIRPVHADLLFAESDPEALLDRLSTQEMPDIEGWLRRV